MQTFPQPARKKKATFKITAAILITVLLFFIMIQFIPVTQTENHSFLKKGKRPLIIAHQGGDGMAPGNTLAAFSLSEKLEVDMLEMDVHLSKDGEVVVIHDDTVDRTTNGTGSVKDMSLEQLKQLDAGYHFVGPDGTHPYRNKGVTIPTMDEIFTTFPGYPMTIELKTADLLLADKMADLIKKHNMTDKVIIASFYDEALNYFIEASDGKVPVSSPSEATRNFVIAHKLFVERLIPMNKYTAVQIPMRASGLDLTSERIVKSLHNRNIAVQYWTINDEDSVRKLVEIGADGIMTDHPNFVKKVLDQEYGEVQ
ncbi:glycerophosphodiester phosphodiesterase [Peribacillus frigoritolerans]|uniref:glycerophosphodiester phosphodiesterase n=1 Tax=Peribacillus frigoritolerans TaxID=450367 RepID=UPI00105A43CE|nr:glycerophosphodiester phosphodiesterase [Peribacillus frigoritolerans]TDL77984.1 glycerophosphodiester phosphodiesterase [Peribacillus frigoritolerans]